MARTSRRKLFLFGRYSIALLLPKRWLVEANINPSDTVDLVLDKKKARIIVELKKNPSQTVTHEKPKKNKKSGNDWQPIPQL